jgi:hypothetical protein
VIEQDYDLISYIPKPLIEITSAKNLSSRAISSLIFDITQQDPSFGILIQKLFNMTSTDSFEKFFSDIGLDQFRNKVAQAYLCHAKVGDYFLKEAQEDIEQIVSIEKQFESFMPPNDFSFFLLLFYLKLCDIKYEALGKTTSFCNYDFTKIKALLNLSSKRSSNISWLCILLNSLMHNIEDDLISLIENAKGDFSNILESLDIEQRSSIVKDHLDYAQAIDSYSYLLYHRD